jgi:hypothetical protein
MTNFPYQTFTFIFEFLRGKRLEKFGSIGRMKYDYEN